MNAAAQAITTYAHVALGARVEAADPHELTLMLYEALLASIDAMCAAGGSLAYIAPRAQALSALHGLERGLDYDADAALARNFATLFRSVAERLTQTDQSGWATARRDVADLTQMWRSLRP